MLSLSLNLSLSPLNLSLPLSSLSLCFSFPHSLPPLLFHSQYRRPPASSPTSAIVGHRASRLRNRRCYLRPATRANRSERAHRACRYDPVPPPPPLAPSRSPMRPAAHDACSHPPPHPHPRPPSPPPATHGSSRDHRPSNAPDCCPSPLFPGYGRPPAGVVFCNIAPACNTVPATTPHRSSAAAAT